MLDDLDRYHSAKYKCEGCGYTIPASEILTRDGFVHFWDMGHVFDGKYVSYPIECGPLTELLAGHYGFECKAPCEEAQ